MDSKSRKRKKDKSFYVRQAKQAKMSMYKLTPDLTGFLVFCNHREKQALHEAYSILNQLADQLYGPEKAKQAEEDSINQSSDEDEDLEKALEKEKKELLEIRSKPVNERRFQSVKTDIQNLIFIRSTLEDPNELVENILQEIKTSGQQKCRYMSRLLPVVKTCKANEESIVKVAKETLPKWFTSQGDSEAITYCINYRSRLNNSLGRDDVINFLNPVIREINDKAVVEYKKPKLVINLEIMKSFCCFSVLKDYYGYKKYNLIELASFSDNGQKESGIQDETSSTEKDQQVKLTE